ncbi:GTP-binding protein [Thiosulfatimonas sediminis]|uniref:GTP-binding protein n=1 Tax=Thiosulfatimonas sediminis TaxID=2675054 RepID=A0A6F8PSK5_9GAMM|nr:GTP-binding protein [Thiosulfatimonas sediminis]BBP44970.1 GTP-binding protein [Thiosulfatimonas sediminis]
MTLPVYLITGLLGSGKSTCLHHLIQQKPTNQNWAVLINEFGEIDIDGAALASQHPNLTIENVSGGCICCSAQFSLSQALGRLIQQPNLDALLIEPTGLGHPAKIIDTLKQFPQLQLAKIICLITPQQLTAERWQKSQVMRDLVHLADLILLNKMDLSQTDELVASEAILSSLYPPKAQQRSQQGQVNWTQLSTPKEPKPSAIFRLQMNKTFSLQNKPAHAAITDTWHSNLPNCLNATLQSNPQDDTVLAIGWQLSPQILFNRSALKQWFAEFSPYFVRAKGLLRTGKEWQLLNYSDSGLQLNDIAWRQDSRLECLFTPSAKIDRSLIKNMETQLLSVISHR